MSENQTRYRRRRRIIHTSDLHLDKLENKASESLTAVIDLAIDEQVDMVIIAGDLFDHNRIENDMLDFVAGQLRRPQMPVVILPGNHDCLIPGSVYERAEFQSSDNVHIIRASQGETLDFPELEVSIWGKCIDSYDVDVLPLEGMPQPQGNGWWHIAVAHGYYVGSETPLFPSYHIFQEEVISSGRSYIALGHLPMFQAVCLAPVAYYCGSPSMSGSVALVELDEETGVRVNQYMLEMKLMLESGTGNEDGFC